MEKINKICIKCKEEKDLKFFHKSSCNKSGFRSKCTNCIDIEKICGIYKITNPSGKIYIGQSKDIKNRWSSYRTRGCKKQTILEKSFSKYGVENHVFEIVELCFKDKLDITERYWQEHFNVVSRKGLNCHYIKVDGKPSVITEESRIKRSLSKMGDLNHNSKEVFDYSSFVFYHSVGEASKILGIERATLYDMLRGKYSNKTNLIFAEDFEKGKLPSSLFTPKVGRTKRKNTGYELVDYVTGNIVGNIEHVSNYEGINEPVLRSYLTGVCSNKTNYIYKKDYDKGLKPNELFCGEFRDISSIDFLTKTTFKTIKDASVFYKVSQKYISNCLNNIKESALPIILLSEYKEGVIYEYSPEKFEKRNTTILNLNSNNKYRNHYEVSKDLNISKDMVAKILNFKCYNSHGIIYERDYIKGLLPNNYNKINKGNKKVYDITTGIQYKSIREACRELGLCNKRQSDYLKNEKYDKTNLRYIL